MLALQTIASKTMAATDTVITNMLFFSSQSHVFDETIVSCPSMMFLLACWQVCSPNARWSTSPRVWISSRCSLLSTKRLPRDPKANKRRYVTTNLDLNDTLLPRMVDLLCISLSLQLSRSSSDLTLHHIFDNFTRKSLLLLLQYVHISSVKRFILFPTSQVLRTHRVLSR